MEPCPTDKSPVWQQGVLSPTVNTQSVLSPSPTPDPQHTPTPPTQPPLHLGSFQSLPAADTIFFFLFFFYFHYTYTHLFDLIIQQVSKLRFFSHPSGFYLASLALCWRYFTRVLKRFFARMLWKAFTGVRRKSEPLDCHHLSAVSSSTFASHCIRKRLRVILLPFRTCGFSVTAWLAGRQATLFCLSVFMQVQNIEDTPLCSPFFFFLRGFSEQPTTAGLEESRPYMWHSEGQPRKGISLSYWEQSRNQSGSAGIRGGMLENNDSRSALRAVL